MNEAEMITLSSLFYEIGRFRIRGELRSGSFLEEGTEWLRSLNGTFAGIAETLEDARFRALLEEAARIATGLSPDAPLPEEPEGSQGTAQPLASLFSLVDPPEGRPLNTLELWVRPHAASNVCAYPTADRPQPEEMQKTYKTLWKGFCEECEAIKENLDPELALVLLEKYCSSIPHLAQGADKGRRAVSLFDQMKLTAAVASCLHATLGSGADESQIRDRNAPRYRLVGGDFSGVQEFIYRITSKGALKALRGRSFFLELLTEHVVQEILHALGLSSAQVLVSSGAVFNLLLPNTQGTHEVLESVRQRLNRYLLEQLDGRLYLALDSVALSGEELVDAEGLAERARELVRALWALKGQRFAEETLTQPSDWEAFLRPEPPTEERSRSELQDDRCAWCGAPKTPQVLEWQGEELQGCEDCLKDEDLGVDECEICHRIALLSPLPPPAQNVKGCPLCRGLYHLGEHLFYVRYVLCTAERPKKPQKVFLKLPALVGNKGDEKDRYYLFPMPKRRPEEACPTDYEFGIDAKDVLWAFVVNRWELDWYKNERLGRAPVRPLALGNYPDFGAVGGPDAPEERIGAGVPLEFKDLAGKARGLPCLGVLRMDVDNLGDIFVQRRCRALAPRMALSRALNRFFKLHLNELCRVGEGAFPQGTETRLVSEPEGAKPKRQAIVIYSGGDDLFVVGAWHDMVELAFDIHAAFEAYTGGRATLSAGLIVEPENFPLYQMARFSQKALEVAKENEHAGRKKDSFALFYPATLFEPQNLEKRRPEALPWTGEGEVSARSCLELAQEMAEALGNGQLGEDWDLAVPKSFLRNLFQVVDVVRQRGQLSLPALLFTLSRVDVEKVKQAKFQELAEKLKKFSTLCYLHPALVWLEMRSRAEVEGRAEEGA